MYIGSFTTDTHRGSGSGCRLHSVFGKRCCRKYERENRKGLKVNSQWCLQTLSSNDKRSASSRAPNSFYGKRDAQRSKIVRKIDTVRIPTIITIAESTKDGRSPDEEENKGGAHQKQRLCKRRRKQTTKNIKTLL